MLLLSPLQRLAEINPLLILALAAALWSALRFIRRQAIWVLLALWIAYCASLLSLPGGRQIDDHLALLPSTGARLGCLAAASATAVPWRSGAELPERCRFEGTRPPRLPRRDPAFLEQLAAGLERAYGS
jgi:hypothetical protein